MENCEFCAEFNQNYLCIQEIGNRIIYKSDNFVDLTKKFPHRSVQSFYELKKQIESGVPYLFVEDNKSQRHVFDVTEHISSQYIRKIITSKIG